MTANASMHDATRGKQGPSMATPSRGPGSLCNNPYLLLKGWTRCSRARARCRVYLNSVSRGMGVDTRGTIQSEGNERHETGGEKTLEAGPIGQRPYAVTDTRKGRCTGRKSERPRAA